MQFSAHMVERNNTGRTDTKQILVVTILGVLLLMGVGFLSSKAPLTKATGTLRADEVVPCSLAAVAGSCGFTLNGTLLLPSGLEGVADSR